MGMHSCASGAAYPLLKTRTPGRAGAHPTEPVAHFGRNDVTLYASRGTNPTA
jgi:hypothetical protein